MAEKSSLLRIPSEFSQAVIMIVAVLSAIISFAWVFMSKAADVTVVQDRLESAQRELWEITTELSARFAGFETEFGALKTEIGTLKSEFDTMKTEIGTLKTEIGTIKSEIGTIKSEFGTLKSQVDENGRILRMLLCSNAPTSPGCDLEQGAGLSSQAVQ